MPIADWLKPGRDDRLVRVGRDLPRGRAVELAVDPDDPAEGGHRVGLERVPVRLDELVVRGEADRVRVLDDGDGRRRVVAGDPVGGVEVEQVVERRHVALEAGRVGERPAAVGRLAVERGPLVRVLAVAQVVHLLEDQREVAREGVAGDLVEVGGDLGVVGGDRAERLGRELRPRLRADRARARAAPRRPAGSAPDPRPPRRPAALRAAAPRSAAPPTSIISIASSRPTSLTPMAGANGLTLTTTRSIRPIPCARELLELGGNVAPGEDPGVDRVVEGLDLTADVGLALRQLGDGRDLDALAGEVLARAVRGEDLDAEIEQRRARARRSRLDSRLTAGLAPGASSRSRGPCDASAGLAVRLPGRSRRRRTVRAEYTA